MKKRIVSLLMALVMALSLLPTSVFAATDTDIKKYFNDRNIPVTAEVSGSSSYATVRWKTTNEGNADLCSGYGGYSSSWIELTFTEDAAINFEYMLDAEATGSTCSITLNDTPVVESSAIKNDGEWKSLPNSIEAKTGDKLKINNYNGDSGARMYLRNFVCGEGVAVTFWNNEESYSQNIYGGSGKLKACTFTDDTKIFAGWAETADGKKKYEDEATITDVTAPVSLYAVWADAAVVTLKDGDKTDTVEVAKDTAIGTKLPANPTKTGYTFGGWWNGETQLTAGTVISADVTYTAQWTPITYTIAFNKGYSDNNETAVDSITATYDREVTLPACTYTRAGYTFNGWGTSSSATSGKTAGTTVKNLESTQGATYTYYPAWKGNDVTVTLNYNDGSRANETRYGTVGSEYYYLKASKDGFSNRISDPTRSGYIFDGWYDAATDGSKVSEYYKFTAADAANGRTLYAHWVEAVTITFDANGGSCYTTSKTIEKDTTLGYSLPSSASRSGYKFDGWYTEETNGTKVTSSTIFDRNTTLYAHWTPYKITVTFNANGGTGTMAKQEIACGSNTLLNACTFTRDGYIFKGWGTYNTSTTVQYEDKALYNETATYNATKTLYAIWEPTAEQKAANEVLDKAEEAIDATYTPKYGTDTNALTMINARLTADDITDVTATMKEAAYSSYNYVGIAADGTIQYKWNEDGATSSANGNLTPTIVLTYSKDGKNYTKESKEAYFSIPLDKAKALAKLKNTAERVTVPTTVEQASDLTTLDKYVLKANVDADDVDYDEYDDFEIWATATWSCNNTKVIKINEPSSWGNSYAPYKVGVTLPGEDTTVTLTMALTYNKNYSASYEGELSVTKTYTVTVKAGEDARKGLYQAALDEVLEKVGLTNPRTGEAKAKINTANVTSDIQFPTTQNIRDNTSLTSFDGKYTPIVITSSDESVIAPVDGKTIANAARMLVYRPLPDEADKIVTVTVKILDRPSGEGTDYENMAVLASREIELTVKPLTQTEIDTAAAFMKKVCTEEVYWDCIKNKNTDKKNITSDLKWFKEILPAENDKGYTFITNVADWNQCGVLAEDIPGWYDSQQYRAFRSSQPDIVRHENLLVTTPQYNTDVTIDSVLSYTEYAKYWEKFGIGAGATEDTKAKYAQFEQFYKQPVSTTVTVLGTTGKDDPNADKAVSAEVSIIGCGDKFLSTATAYTYTAAKAGVNVTAWDAVKACLDANGYTYEGSGSYVSSITDKNGVKLGEKEYGTMSGWMFRVIRDGQTIVPGAVMANYSLKTGDKVEVYYMADSVQPIDPTRSADEVEALIAAIGEVSLASESAVTAARTAYDNLAVSEKAFVENYDVLAAAETKLASLIIDDIGTVDLTKGTRIARARLTYNKLAAVQKSAVANYATLTAAETKYAELTAAQSANIKKIYETTGEYMLGLGTPVAGGGEWYALGLARSGKTVGESYYDGVVEYVKANIDSNGRLNKNYSNTNSLAILTLTALGKDVTNVGGYNLLKGLDNMAYIEGYGINNVDFALLALDSYNYTPLGDVTRDKLVQAILKEQLTDGGWAYAGSKADPDLTAMTIQALAPYYTSNNDVKTAVDKALNTLSGMQNTSGTFTTTYTLAGQTNSYDSSETCAQVVVALTALGLDPATDSRFIKNGISVLDALCSFALEGGGFKHVAEETTPDKANATPQGYYALVAYNRFVNQQNSLYNMTDTCVHSFSAWTVTKAATCTEAGSSSRTCSKCHTTETLTIAAFGHKLTATAAKAATCTTAGNSAYWACATCGKYYSDAAGKTEITKDSWVIKALGHTPVTGKDVSATCYTSGHKGNTYCTRCGEIETLGANIPATGKHSYVNGVCATCGVKNPTAGIKTNDLKVDTKNDKVVKDSSGLLIKALKEVTEEIMKEIKTAIESGAVVVNVDNTKAVQPTADEKKADGGKSALEKKIETADTATKAELTKLADKLTDMRKDSGKKDAQLEKVLEITVDLVKTADSGSVESVAQLVELPKTVTVTVDISEAMYHSLMNRKVCVLRSHTDVNGSVETAELPAKLSHVGSDYKLSFDTDKASSFAIVSYEAVSTTSHTNRPYIVIDSSAASATTTTTVKKSNSATTFDPGVGLYTVTAILSVTGMAWVGKKKH